MTIPQKTEESSKCHDKQVFDLMTAGHFLLAAATGIDEQTTFAQTTQDPRVVDLVRAGELRVGIGLGVLMQAVNRKEVIQP